MATTTLALTICTALALLSPSTRGIGIIGTGVLILLHPTLTITTIVSSAVAYYIYKHDE